MDNIFSVMDTFRSISPSSDLLTREEKAAVETSKRVSFQTLSTGFLEDSTTFTSSNAPPFDECQDDWLNGDLSAAWSDSTDSSAYTVTMNEDFPEVDYPYHTEPLKTRSPLFFNVGGFQDPGRVGDMAPLSPLSPLSPMPMWQTSASACVYSCRSAKIQSNRIVGDLIDRGVDNHDREGSTIH